MLALLLIAGVYVAAPNASLAAGPLLTGPPTISGSPVVGQTLTASAPSAGRRRTTTPRARTARHADARRRAGRARPGAAARRATPQATKVSYTWQRCAATGCAAIPAAVGASLVLTSADAGNTIVVAVTATDADPADTSTGQSAPFGPVGSPPTITKPTIIGAAAVGATLTATATAGGYPRPAVTYQWGRCPAAAGSCVAVAGATGPTFAVTSADGGTRLAVSATARNTIGSAAQISDPTGVVAFVAVTTPTIGGSPSVGNLLTAAATAAGSPTPTLTYGWQRCDASAICTSIAGATGPRYTVAAPDAGSTLRVVATADNGSTRDMKASAPVGPVTAAPTLGRPTISGATAVGQTLQAGATIGGSPTPTLSYQWQRCRAGASACRDIAQATGAQYTLVDADLGNTIRVGMTAVNGVRPAATGLSATTGVIRAVTTANPPFQTSGSGTATGAPATGGVVGLSPARALTPFPLIRLRGRLAGRGAYVTLLTVTAPVGAKVFISCTGKSCPKKHVAFVARRSKTRVRSFQGLLRAGVRLSIRVSRRGYIGKITTFVIHANREPARTDGCLDATSGKVITCT